VKLAPLMLALACLAALPPPAMAWPKHHHSAWPRLHDRAPLYRTLYYGSFYARPHEGHCAELLSIWTIRDDSGERTRKGRLKRSRLAREAFQCATPCPSTHDTQGPCPGYVVDHVIPLKSGGADLPDNMQWQTIAEAKAKDRVE
jgi:hypothetical protein